MMACHPLLEVLKEVPDFRKARGKKYPLHAILMLVCAATLCGCKSYGAIAERGGRYGKDLVRRLGFEREKTPGVGTFFTILSHLDWNVPELKLYGRLQEVMRLQGAVPCLSFDGKTLRGSRRQGAGESHILSVFIIRG